MTLIPMTDASWKVAARHAAKAKVTSAALNRLTDDSYATRAASLANTLGSLVSGRAQKSAVAIAKEIQRFAIAATPDVDVEAATMETISEEFFDAVGSVVSTLSRS